MIQTRSVYYAMILVAASVIGCADPGRPGSDGEGDSTTDTSGAHPGASTSTSGGASTSGGTSSSSPSASSSGSPAAAAACAKGTKSYGTLGSWECIPSNAPPKAGLVIALHGYTQGVQQGGTSAEPWGYKPTTQWDVLAEKHKFYVLYPDKGTQSFSWYAFFGTSGIARTDLEPSSIAQMVKDFIAAHDVDPEKVFINGLSAGAYMTTVMLATYPDLFAGGSTFAGGAYGCSTSCAALGKKGQGWSWPGNHAASLVTQAYPTVWSNASARKPRRPRRPEMRGGAVTPENLADLTQQWTGAVGIAGAGTTSTLKGHEYVEYSKNGTVMFATVTMKGIGHGTPVDPGSAADQGGWDPVASQTASSDPNAAQDWTNTAGIYGPYYSAKFWGLIQ